MEQGYIVKNAEGKQAWWDGKTLSPVNIAPGVNPAELQGLLNVTNQAPPNEASLPPAPGTAAPQAAPEQTLTQKVMGYGKTAASIALPALGEIGGGALGALAGPGGLLAGGMAGGMGGEALSQGLGLSEPSGAQIALAGAGPIAGRLLGAVPKAFGTSVPKAVSSLSKYLPKSASQDLFAKAGKTAIDAVNLKPVTDTILTSPAFAGKAALPGTPIGDFLLKAPKGLTFADAGIVKDDFQAYANHLSKAGTEGYNPSLAREYKKMSGAIVDAVDAANPGYKEALAAYGKEQNVHRMQAFFGNGNDIGEKLKTLRATPITDLNRKQRLMIGGFDPKELDEIQEIADKLPKSLSFKQLLEGRIAGGAIAGTIGVASGGSGGVIGGAILAGMMAQPFGRRLIKEAISSGSINSPSKMAVTLQIGRAMLGRQPQSEPESQPSSQ